MSRAHISEILFRSIVVQSGIRRCVSCATKSCKGRSWNLSTHHAPSEIFSPGLESVLFRTLSYFCRVPDKFPRSDHRKMANLCADDADCGLTHRREGL